VCRLLIPLTGSERRQLSPHLAGHVEDCASDEDGRTKRDVSGDHGPRDGCAGEPRDQPQAFARNVSRDESL